MFYFMASAHTPGVVRDLVPPWSWGLTFLLLSLICIILWFVCFHFMELFNNYEDNLSSIFNTAILILMDCNKENGTKTGTTIIFFFCYCYLLRLKGSAKLNFWLKVGHTMLRCKFMRCVCSECEGCFCLKHSCCHIETYYTVILLINVRVNMMID